MTQEKIISQVTPECEIIYTDGTSEQCPHTPPYTFSECAPGYGSHGLCPKYDYHHRKAKDCTDGSPLWDHLGSRVVRICNIHVPGEHLCFCENRIKFGRCPKGIKEV